MTAPHRDEGSRTKGMQVERKPYEAIQVRRLTPLIGAEISGVDLSGPLGNQAFDEIHRALMEHLVIFFRDQTLTPSSISTSAPASASCTCIRSPRTSPGCRR